VPETREELTRRAALAVIAGASATWAFGCSSSTSGGHVLSSSDAGSSGGEEASGAEAGSYVVTPEGEIGPYFADDSATGFNRSNILSSLDGSSTQSGVPLTLTVTVVDTEKSCAPYANAQVDIWQCNAAGVYSDISAENTSSETWLRGYQLTDARGQVTFTTIVPGWYSGRTNHIHLRVRSTYSDVSSTSDGANTTQLFFAQTLIDTLATSVAPIQQRGDQPDNERQRPRLLRRGRWSDAPHALGGQHERLHRVDHRRPPHHEQRIRCRRHGRHERDLIRTIPPAHSPAPAPVPARSLPQPAGSWSG
jgi:protocatechuate 3,4-dioxygenase beta subunit